MGDRWGGHSMRLKRVSRRAFLVIAAQIVWLTAWIYPARAEIVVVDAKAIYPEGPLWQNGKLFYVEYGGPGIKMWDGTRTGIYWRGEHCGPSGLIAYGRGHLLVACYDANTVVELDDAGKVIRTIDRDGAGKRFTGPNDFAADGAGGIY